MICCQNFINPPMSGFYYCCWMKLRGKVKICPSPAG
nr:MAG TPA: Glucose-induced degradation protein-like protein [Caudoviricetes sp.]